MFSALRITPFDKQRLEGVYQSSKLFCEIFDNEAITGNQPKQQQQPIMESTNGQTIGYTVQSNKFNSNGIKMKHPRRIFQVALLYGQMLAHVVFSLALAPPSNIHVSKNTRHHSLLPLRLHPFSHANADNQHTVASSDTDTATMLHLAIHESNEYSRRSYLKKALIGVVVVSPTITAIPASSNAASTTAEGIKTFEKGKGRNEGYNVQHSTSEWTTLLSGAQYNVLRKGGTERQRGSILEKEKRPGIFVCAGCDEALFAISSKFDSGTGWPSFDSAVGSDAVEIEDVGWILSMDGAEVRCRTCGGHLGDVFGDGWKYGSKSGKRYCINGSALVFRPMDGGKELRGDIPPPNKVIQYEPSLRKDS